MTDLSPSSFDEWYSAINATGAFDAQVRRGLELPDGLGATGLVSGPAFVEVVQSLALSPDELLLDLACGRGGYGLAAAQAAEARLVGIDFSSVAIQAARSAAEALGMTGRARFVVGDLAATGLDPASVNAVMCLDSIQFATPLRAAFDECRRVLAPGGRLVLTCWEAADAQGPQLPERLRQLNLGAALREGGFEHVSIQERPDWLELERRHWEAALAMDPNGDAGLEALREEAEEVLPMIPRMRRVLATAIAPPVGDRSRVGESNRRAILSVVFRRVWDMAAVALVRPVCGSTDPVSGWLEDVMAQLGAVVADGSEVSDADRIDRIARLEQLRAVTAAVQAAECVKFAQSQVREQLEQDVHPKVLGRGIADQIALACHVSPYAGSRRLSTARALWFDLPQLFGALTVGALSERVAELVVTETRHLDATTRRAVDAQLVAAGITGMGVRAAAACVRRLAYEADRQAYVRRGRTERRHRRVGLRPAPDTMAVLTGYLPVEQGVACLAALRRHTDGVLAHGDERSRDQIMADTLVERVTGQVRATDIDVEVHILIPVDALCDPASPRTATVVGAGPLPVGIAWDIISNTQGRRWWRRLFTEPTGHGREMVVGGDPARQRFDGWLAKLINLRDQTCRDPFCDAAIRHIDHIVRRADRGPATLSNGRGVCARGNYVREMPGWQVDVMHTGFGSHPHTVTIRTPTGHTYLSRAPDPP